MKKSTKAILWGGAALISAAAAAGYAAGKYLYAVALDPKNETFTRMGGPPDDREQDTDSKAVLWKEEQDQHMTWAEEHGVASMYITSDDGLRLHAHTILRDSGGEKWVVLIHGYRGNGTQMFYFAKHFYDMGYSVLMPDARAHGLSEGGYIGMGWHERVDIVRWSEKIAELNKGARIVIFGISMGGATAMMASGEELPENVAAIVEDCGYSSIHEQLAYNLKNMYKLPPFPFLSFSSGVAKMRAGYNLREGDAVKQVAKSLTPTLFIHGDKDDFVPFFMLDKVYEACSAPKERLVVEDAGHGEASRVDPEKYWSTVESFLEKYV